MGCDVEKCGSLGWDVGLGGVSHQGIAEVRYYCCCTHPTTGSILFPLTRVRVGGGRADLGIKTHAGRGDAREDTWMFHEASHMQSDDRIMSCIASLFAPAGDSTLAQCRADKNGLLIHL